MYITKRGLLALLGSILSGAAPFAASAQEMSVAEVAQLSGPDRQETLIEGAKDEGEFVVYSSMIANQALRPITEAFAQKYPFLDVQYSRANSRDIVNKALSEIRANSLVADVVEGGGISPTLIEAGVAQSFSTPSLDRYDPQFYGSEGRWAATRLSFFGTAYNTRQVSEDEAPQTYDDLLDPKWKGKIAWAATAETGGATMFITLMREWKGEEAAEQYLAKLAEQDIANLSGSPREVVNQVMAGEYPIAINIFLHHPLISAAEGASIDSQPMEPVGANASVIVLLKQAPHPHAAMLFIDFMLSPEGQNILKNANYFPSDPDIEPKEMLAPIVPSEAGLEVIFLTEEDLYEARDRSIELFNEYFK